MTARTGEEFLQGIRGPRNIWMDGERIDDVAEHPALSGAARSLAAVFDLQHQAADICLTTDPETGETMNLSHIFPASRDDLVRRRKCIEKTAEYSVGLMGRTPDYLNVTFAGFAGSSEEWATHGNEDGAENLVAYQRNLRREDWALTHAIVAPTADKAKGDTPRPGDTVTVRKIEDTEHGILVRGSKALATLAPFADEIAVYPRTPLPEGSEAYALAFCVPLSTPGLKFICRDSMSRQTNRVDHPLSSRFDEQDAFVIFDDVEVPRDRVFIDGNLAVNNTVMTTSWLPNITHQTMIRATVKLEFSWGLARHMAEAVNANDPGTQQMLGEIWAYGEFARSAVLAAEAEARDYGNGFWAADPKPLNALRCLLPVWFPRVNEMISQLGSHFMLATPRAAQFDDPELTTLLDTYLSGANDVGAERRARLFRLAWDFTNSEMGGRNQQYERFYLGSSGRNLQRSFLFADATRSDRLVDRFLNETIDD